MVEHSPKILASEAKATKILKQTKLSLSPSNSLSLPPHIPNPISLSPSPPHHHHLGSIVYVCL